MLDGTQLAIPGLSGKVVNVITDGVGTTDGTSRDKIRLRENLPPSLNEGTVTLAVANGALSWSLEADSAPQRAGDASWWQILDGQGNLLEQRKEDFTRVSDDASLSGWLGWKPASGVIANLNAKIGVGERTASRFPGPIRWALRKGGGFSSLPRMNATPKSAGIMNLWLNQVGNGFSILQGKSLAGPAFTSVAQLKDHIDAFIASYNEGAAPFLWTKTKVCQRKFKNDVSVSYDPGYQTILATPFGGLSRCWR